MLYNFLEWFESIGIWGLFIIAISGFITAILIFITVINYVFS